MAPTHSLIELVDASTNWLKKQGSTSARLDTELLAAEVLGMERLQLYLNFDRPMEATETTRLRELITRRGSGEPVAYILGSRDFHKVTIPVGAGVLVPRPETEALVEFGLSHLDEQLPLAPQETSTGADKNAVEDAAEAVDGGEQGADAEGADAGRDEARPTPLWLDLCTGSACVPVAAAVARPDLKAVAVELSEAALEWARKSVAAYSLEQRVALRQGDLYGAVPDRFRAHFHVLTANPPYIADSDDRVDPSVRSFEPHEALFAGADGLALLRPIVQQAKDWLAPGGLLLCEIGLDQGGDVLKIAQESGLQGAEILKDLAGHDRILRARSPAEDDPGSTQAQGSLDR